MFGLRFARYRWKQGTRFCRCCEPGHWKGEEIFDRTGINAVRPTRDKRPFRDGNRCAPAFQRFAPNRQTPLKTGEILPLTGGLNGFERVIVAEGTRPGASVLQVKPLKELHTALCQSAMDVDLARPTSWIQPTTIREANGSENPLGAHQAGSSFRRPRGRACGCVQCGACRRPGRSSTPKLHRAFLSCGRQAPRP